MLPAAPAVFAATNDDIYLGADVRRWRHKPPRRMDRTCSGFALLFQEISDILTLLKSTGESPGPKFSSSSKNNL